MATEDTANSAVHQALDQGRQAATGAGRIIKDGYAAAQQYVTDDALAFDLREFVRREPWIAITAAFAVGYVAARLIRRFS
jgi:ElaB/YqjD/DUF883 family membrane-anchored ribosome-binding protein